MLNRLSDLIRLRTFATEQVQPVSGANLAALSDLLPGDQVRAYIKSAMPDGTFLATIRNQPFMLSVPFEAHAGDILQLSVLEREPQMKFAMVKREDYAGLPTKISETARFITALLGETEKLPHAPLAASSAPLLSALPDDSRQTASTLRNTLAHSGVFYEAHQAQWVAGERELESLRREPQGQLKPLGADPPHAAPDGDAEQPAVVILDKAPRLPELPVHRDALAMIKQQLDTLESGRIAWHGLIWHGQPLDWDVDRQPDNASATTDVPPWRTRLRLTLPRLGKIDATLVVAGNAVNVTLRATDAGTRSEMTEQRSSLQLSLRNAGIDATAISVRRDDDL